MKMISEVFPINLKGAICHVTAYSCLPHIFEINFDGGMYAKGSLNATQLKKLGQFLIEVSDAMQADIHFKKVVCEGEVEDNNDEDYFVNWKF